MSLVTESLPKASDRNSAKDQKGVATVAVVFTGGTIAMTPSTKGVVPTLAGRDIINRVPEIKQYLPNLRLEVHDFATLPGPHVSPEMMLTLADFVRALMENADGVVVTHGTDSMEECAFFPGPCYW